MSVTKTARTAVLSLLCAAFASAAAWRASAADDSWRVKVLDNSTAGTGLIQGAGRETLLAAWKVKAPIERIAGGQFSLVYPQPAVWRVWCHRDEKGILKWQIETLDDAKWTARQIPADVPSDGWLEVEVVMEPRAVTLQFGGKARGRFEHDAYAERFKMNFTSRQTVEGGPTVNSEYRETSLQTISYPYKVGAVPDGPEDIRPEDGALCYMVNPGTPKAPRQGEGDLIERTDGSLLIVWTDFFDGLARDYAPDRISARISTDAGKTWGKPWTIVKPPMPYQLKGPPPGQRWGGPWSVTRNGKVEPAGGPSPRHPSLLRAGNGDVLLANVELLPDMPIEGLVVRRSSDDGLTWSKPRPMTPINGNRHLANCACLRMLSTGRMILSCREYVDGIRWPYCVYSDDDGHTWKAGQHVPDPGLPPEQKSGQNVNEPSVAVLADGRLLMTMRSIAGGQFFSYSDDGGETWTKPLLSPLRGRCSPAAIRRIPGSDDVLAIWNYGFTHRSPLVSAISSDGGSTWKHLKLVEQNEYHGYCYTSITFVNGKVYLTYYHYPGYSARQLFASDEDDFHYHDQRLTVLPIEWFYRDVSD